MEQRQTLLGHFEALGQPLAQPFHRLVGGHRQLVAGACRAVDGQAHGRRLGRRAQLAGAAGGPAPAAPGAAGLRLHPRPALRGWGPRGAANSRRASGQSGLGERSQTGFLCVPGSGGQRASLWRRSQEWKVNQKSKIRVELRGRVGSPGRLPRWGLHSQLLSRAAGSGKGPRRGGAAHPAALRDVCYSGRASPRVPSLSNSRRHLNSCSRPTAPGRVVALPRPRPPPPPPGRGEAAALGAAVAASALGRRRREDGVGAGA